MHKFIYMGLSLFIASSLNLEWSFAQTALPTVSVSGQTPAPTASVSAPQAVTAQRQYDDCARNIQNNYRLLYPQMSQRFNDAIPVDVNTNVQDQIAALNILRRELRQNLLSGQNVQSNVQFLRNYVRLQTQANESDAIAQNTATQRQDFLTQIAQAVIRARGQSGSNRPALHQALCEGERPVGLPRFVPGPANAQSSQAAAPVAGTFSLSNAADHQNVVFAGSSLNSRLGWSCPNATENTSYLPRRAGAVFVQVVSNPHGNTLYGYACSRYVNAPNSTVNTLMVTCSRIDILADNPTVQGRTVLDATSLARQVISGDISDVYRLSDNRGAVELPATSATDYAEAQVAAACGQNPRVGAQQRRVLQRAIDPLIQSVPQNGSAGSARDGH